MIKSRRFKCLCVFIFILFPLGADILYDASLLEKSGDSNKAIKLYDKWLSSNENDARFFEILMHSASLIPLVKDSILQLLKYEDSLSSDKQKHLNTKIALLYELSFHKEKASHYYKKASLNDDGTIDYRLYLQYLILSFELGNIPTLGEIDRILLSNLDKNHFIKTLLFKTEILMFQGQNEEAFSILSNSEYVDEYSEFTYSMWRIQKKIGNRVLVNSLVKDMERKFPHAIELKIMTGLVDKQILLSDYLNISLPSMETESEFKKSYVQVGSLRKRENIEFLTSALKKSHFNFIQEERNGITRIIVVDTIPSNQLLINLKEEGFEGFVINYHLSPE